MPSTQISIRTEIYEKLKRQKRPGESFSDLIERILPTQSNLDDVLACVGIAKENQGDPRVASAYAEGRRTAREAINARLGASRKQATLE